MNTNTASTLDELSARSEQTLTSKPSGIHVVSGRDLSHLSDDEVLASTRRLVGRSNQIFAALLVHLAEVDARGLHRQRACSSLYTYCIYELRLSEDAAFRRISAARLVKRFPALFDAIERGELHLTGLLMLGPHLTPENHLEVLAHAKHRTKKEIAKLVRVLDPLPEVPARLEPLGLAPTRNAPANPSWEQHTHSMNPVRELSAGERPGDWMDKVPDSDEWENEASEPAPARATSGSVACASMDEDSPNEYSPTVDATGGSAPARATSGSVACASMDEDSPNEYLLTVDATGGSAPARATSGSVATTNMNDAPARVVQALVGPQRYKVQFTAGEEYVNLMERAKALLSHTAPSTGLVELHVRAMRALVAELEKRKYAVKTPPESAHAVDGSTHPSTVTSAQQEPNLGRRDTSLAVRSPRQRGRAVPAAVQREVWTRDEARCSYVDPTTGQRCRETHQLELHHETAYARGGAHRASNLTLRCVAHNTLAAEADFGRAFIAQRKDEVRHESLVRQG